MKHMIDVFVTLTHTAIGAAFVLILLIISLRVLYVSWNHFHEAVVGPDGKMSPKEFGTMITGICLLLMVVAGPVFQYEYSEVMFGTIALAYLGSIGINVYADKKLNGHANKDSKTGTPGKTNTGQPDNL